MNNKIIDSCDKIDYDSLKKYIEEFISEELSLSLDKTMSYSAQFLDLNTPILNFIVVTGVNNAEDTSVDLTEICNSIISEEGALPDTILYDEVLNRVVSVLQGFYTLKKVENSYLNADKSVFTNEDKLIFTNANYPSSPSINPSIKISYPSIYTDYNTPGSYTDYNAIETLINDSRDSKIKILQESIEEIFKNNQYSNIIYNDYSNNYSEVTADSPEN